jgi:hypothetical protein
MSIRQKLSICATQHKTVFRSVKRFQYYLYLCRVQFCLHYRYQVHSTNTNKGCLLPSDASNNKLGVRDTIQMFWFNDGIRIQYLEKDFSKNVVNPSWNTASVLFPQIKKNTGTSQYLP